MIAAPILADIRRRLERVLARPQGTYLPWRVDAGVVGWVDPGRAARLAAFPDVFAVAADGIRFVPRLAKAPARNEALERVARALAAEGALTAWRDERYVVAADRDPDGALRLERCAARYFGIRTYGAHVNGLVARADGVAMWIARRSPTKAIDPGMLDNLIGGGIAAGAEIAGTVVKEAWEEAGIPAPLARRTRPVAALHVCRAQPDGLQRETIYAHDLALAADFVPAGQDGEVVGQQLVPLAGAAALVANADGPDVVTADASLVIVDCLLRHGAIAADAPEFLALDALRHPSLSLAS